MLIAKQPTGCSWRQEIRFAILAVASILALPSWIRVNSCLAGACLRAFVCFVGAATLVGNSCTAQEHGRGT